MLPFNNLFAGKPGANSPNKRRLCIPRGEGLSSVRSIPQIAGSPAKSARLGPARKSTRLGSPSKTCGRFSIRGPAAWRKDGGTGKNTNTMFLSCLALPYALWPSCHHHYHRSGITRRKIAPSRPRAAHGKRARRSCRPDRKDRSVGGRAMRCHRPPLSILFDEGIGENNLGGKRLALEVSRLRRAPRHHCRIPVSVYLHV
jgi:hypothetical protein